jgi:predicted transcriptional regulator
MQLDTWMAETGTTNEALAEALGVTSVAVSRYRTRKRIPRQANLEKITAHTNGLVTPNDFYAPATGTDGGE